MSLRRVYAAFRSVRVHIHFELRFGGLADSAFPRVESDYILRLGATRLYKDLLICSRPQRTRLFSSYTAARKFLSGCEEGIGVLTLYFALSVAEKASERAGSMHMRRSINNSTVEGQ